MGKTDIKMKKISNIVSIVGIISLIVLTGCVGTKAGAYKVFSDDLKHLEGKPFKEAYVFFVGYLAEEKPFTIKYLKNNNEIRVYIMRKERNQACTVYIEVDPKTELVIEASSRGDGCWRPY